MKYSGALDRLVSRGHPPHGGCGLKSEQVGSSNGEVASPSTRRVWIEIEAMTPNELREWVTLHTEGVD